MAKDRSAAVEIRRAYVQHGRVQFSSDEPSMTKQSFKDECDVNVIMKRFERTGILPTPIGGEPRYLDVSAVDYVEAMREVANARTLFEELPARLRDRFENDPQRMLEFLEDPKNVEEGRELGLLRPKEPEVAPVSVRVTELPEAPVARPEADKAPPKGRG